MVDHFEDKAEDWDTRPIPMQISQGVGAAMRASVPFAPDHVVLDFGAGTGLVAGQVASLVQAILAVDISASMLAMLAEKQELAGKVHPRCQDILSEPLDERVDGVVSAMAAHHVQDTAGLLRTLFSHTRSGGFLALADLDAEDGTFHPPGIEGVFHAGFERGALATLAVEAGYVEVTFETACEVIKDGRSYPIFLMTATRP